MNSFPPLSTQAVMQYPAPMITGQGVQVIRFLDGSDQRCLTQGRSFRTWRIQLDLLNEQEIAQIESFFSQQAGDYSTFVFPDPFTGTVVPNCRLATAELVTRYLDIDNSSTLIWVIETNG
ncbi:MAG TPA: hypothetical protein VH351_17920 [Bryobacteraceae bacterium]|jgi:phage-related protein|nr:hypothetical protein [Bryobacteraceae bacterium]